MRRAIVYAQVLKPLSSGFSDFAWERGLGEALCLRVSLAAEPPSESIPIE